MGVTIFPLARRWITSLYGLQTLSRRLGEHRAN
jgi:hypothetical protein